MGFDSNIKETDAKWSSSLAKGSSPPPLALHPARITNADDLEAEFTDEEHMLAFDDALNYDDNATGNEDYNSISRSNSVANIELITSKSDWAPVYNSTDKPPTLDKKKLRKIAVDEEKSFTFTVLRYPLLIFISLWLLFLSVMYFCIRLSVFVSEQIINNTGERKRLKEELKSANSYQEYIEKAKVLDKHLGLDQWCLEDRFYCYDWKTLRRIVKDLRRLRKESQYEDLMVVLQGCVKSNFAGIENPLLYSHCYYGTKRLVEAYNREVIAAINCITDAPDIPIDEKRIFFKILSRNYGKTALALSGGASFCYNHYGILKALLENDLMPKILSGTSGGGIIAALATTRTDKELLNLLTPKLARRINASGQDSALENLKRWWKTGAVFDSLDLARKAQWWTLGSTTFKECYERTGKILNISTVPHDIHSPTILCNFITSPNCCIWSSLLASAAVPGILKPVVLMEKDRRTGTVSPFSFGSKWKDGSLRTDIPLESLNAYFNVKFTIVSQVNPHVLLWFFKNKGDIGNPVSRSKGKGYRGGFLTSYFENLIKLESIKWLKLMKEFQIMPNFMESDWSSIFLQRFAGSITLFPRVKISDYFHLLSDPTEDQLATMMKNGERVAYPKLLFIRHRLSIERAIEKGRRASSAHVRETSIEATSDREDSQIPVIGGEAIPSFNVDPYDYSNDDDDDDNDSHWYEESSEDDGQYEPLAPETAARSGESFDTMVPSGTAGSANLDTVIRHRTV